MSDTPHSEALPVIAAERALVLGPGGPVGTAWLLGLAAGLRKHGVDLAAADTIVGTSAGAIAGVLIARGDDLFELADPAARHAERGSLTIDPAAAGAAFDTAQELAAGGDPVAVRQEIGRIALRANTSPVAERIERMAALVGTGPLPHPGLLVAAVEADTGIPVVWSATDGVPVHLAITGSTAAPGLAAPSRSATTPTTTVPSATVPMPTWPPPQRQWY